MSERTGDAERIARAYVEMWNEREFARIPGLVSESFVHVDPDGTEFRGPDALEAFMREVTSGFPDFHVAVEEMISAGSVVMYEAELTMTHEGEFEGIPPTGRSIVVPEMATIRVADGAVHEHRVYYDNHAVLEQLGLTAD